MSDNTAVRAAKLDKIFGTPVCAVLLAIFCNVLWGSAFPFIKLGYRLFAIDSADTASILCFAGVRFMMGAALVWLAGLALNRRPLPMPRGKQLAVCCGLGLWQTAAQYFFYYSAVALLTGAMGGILNSTQSFMGVILAHFLYGNKDRLTPRKALGCALGFGGVLVATLGNHGGGSVSGAAFDELHGLDSLDLAEMYQAFDAVWPADKDDPALELIAVIPYRKRLDSLNKKTRTRELLEACADVVVIQEKYLPSVYSHRNRYMVEHSDRVIAVYDGRETGGTAKTIRFTHRMKKELREIPVGEIVLPDHLKPKTK